MVCAISLALMALVLSSSAAKGVLLPIDLRNTSLAVASVILPAIIKARAKPGSLLLLGEELVGVLDMDGEKIK